jgi:uncharacterized RmlC-like cupin family protein
MKAERWIMEESKYGKYIISASGEAGNDEYSKTIASLDYGAIKGSYSCRIIRIKPRKRPAFNLPVHKHDSGKFLVFLGTNRYDPYDLGAEVELYMGEEPEKHVITRPTIVYIPDGMIQSPGVVKRADRPFTLVEIGQGPPSADGFSDKLSDEYTGNARAKYDRYFVSGSPEEPGPGPNLGRIDDKVLEGCHGCQATWLPPENAPFPAHPPHVHDSAEFLIHIGTNPDDPYELGAEVELCMGKEMERHVITRPSIIFLPKGFIHGPWTIKRVDSPWISMKVGQGPRGVGEYTLALDEGKKGIRGIRA